jgi:Pyruvate/2-oxoacid:ferredoxin oxidoreductase delta subunit
MIAVDQDRCPCAGRLVSTWPHNGDSSFCKSCLSQCQFGSLLYSSALGKVYIEPGRCFGCGVCRSACPTDAIALVPRETHPVAASLWH